VAIRRALVRNFMVWYQGKWNYLAKIDSNAVSSRKKPPGRRGGCLKIRHGFPRGRNFRYL
jgi:hypothetical protein